VQAADASFLLSVDPGLCPESQDDSIGLRNLIGWVLVNYSPKAKTSEQLVAVDYWLLALGVPRDTCICPYTTFVEEWEKEFSLSPISIVETANPDSQA
jgi:hypothetical protein